MPIQPALTALNLPNAFRRQANSSADQLPELIAYRNEAYVKMGQLLKELGPAPLNNQLAK